MQIYYKVTPIFYFQILNIFKMRQLLQTYLKLILSISNCCLLNHTIL